MILTSRVRRTVSAAVAFAILAVAAPAFAQENISESHLKAARAAVTAIKTTEDFDKILPQAAAALKAELIQKNPDLQAIIVKTVDEETLALAPRRADLEKEAALAYARVFTEQDLNDIADLLQLRDRARSFWPTARSSRASCSRRPTSGSAASRAILRRTSAPSSRQIVKSQAPDPAAPAPGADAPAPAAAARSGCARAIGRAPHRDPASPAAAGLFFWTRRT